jgi:hypothetical protein
MRRLVIIGACLVGLGWLAWLVWRKWAAGEDRSQPETDTFVSPAPQPEPELSGAAATDSGSAAGDEVAPESYRPSGQWATGQGDPEKLLGELTQLRHDALKKVHRRPLYVTAEERGVPIYRRAFMTNGQLFDAILDAEGVSPGTVSPSPATVERVRDLTLQMFEFGGA